MYYFKNVCYTINILIGGERGKLISAVSGIINGTVKISDRKKYSTITVAIACVHMLLILIFRTIGSVPMTIYNVCSVVGYLMCLPLIRRNALSWVFAYICVEVPLHSFLAIYTAGWNYGFAMYLIAIVPVGFDMSFALKNPVRGIKISMIFGLFSFVTFISCRMFSYYNMPLYSVDNEFFVQIVFFFNMLCTFLLLLVYSFIFASEINVAQTVLRKKNSELANLASKDALTGFYNRRKMHEYLVCAAEGKEVFSLIMSDIDNFKKLNDTYGHDCGDEALKAVSDACRSCISDGDRICRWGGEEFLILTNRPLNAAADTAEKIRSAVEHCNLTFNGIDIKITMTLGVSEFDPSSTIDKVITAADQKLYIGKNSGKNRVVK
ncbi:MAG: diguanylate cyclase [Oscillospiraceae bacterium]|nr:diguanylate cyclase [Oscillospiraceae bacterium]